MNANDPGNPKKTNILGDPNSACLATKSVNVIGSPKSPNVADQNILLQIIRVFPELEMTTRRRTRRTRVRVEKDEED